MMEASSSSAQDLCNYQCFRETDYNFEVKKDHHWAFLTSHHPMNMDIWVLCTVITEQLWKPPGKKGLSPTVGGLLQHRWAPPPSPLTCASHTHTHTHTHTPHCEPLCIWGRLPAATWSPLHPAVINTDKLLWSMSYTEEDIVAENGDFVLAKDLSQSLLPHSQLKKK